MSNYNRNQKTVYIPDYLKATWEQAVRESDKGLGYTLLEAWCKVRKIKCPEYQSKGDKSKQRSK